MGSDAGLGQLLSFVNDRFGAVITVLLRVLVVATKFALQTR